MLLILYLDLLDKSFEKYSYRYPQPLIKIFGLNIVNWILNYINLKNFNKTIIIYNNELFKYDIKYTLESYYPSMEFSYFYISFNKITKISLLEFIESMNINEPYLLTDTKYFFLKDILSLVENNNTLFYIKDTKESIQKPLFTIYVNGNYNNISKMIDSFKSIQLYQDIYISLETPFHIRLFCNNFPKIHALTNNLMITKKTIAFDLDDIKNGYSIDIIQYLYKLGNTIIIETNLSQNDKDEIHNILEEKNIKYHHIYFNKPNYDFHISTKSFTYNDNLEKDLGFYNNKIETREFNNIIETNIKTYTKTSNDLSGEINYYLNIPSIVKDIFPIMFNYNPEYKSYDMENINGIPISKLYLNEELTIEQLDNVLGTLNRIHAIKSDYNDYVFSIYSNYTYSIYGNYVNKLEKRYINYDYSIFENSQQLYDLLYKELQKYENQDLGIKTMIHGDAVFTNILINNLGKIKLIDMRGKLDNILSIYGDKLYDWAKIYQSLLGYDEILENKYISKNYKNELIEYFLHKFLVVFKDPIYIYYLKIITGSLLFTLIPLHNNEKCVEYYKLINNLNLFNIGI